MSIEELLGFIKSELQGCSGYAFVDRVLSDLRKIMVGRPHFQPEKFKKWFLEKNVIYKNSPISFLAKCGVEDIEKGAFDKQLINGFDMLPLYEYMRVKGITYTGEDVCYLETYLIYIYNNDLMTLEEISFWLDKAVAHIENHGKNASDFKELLRKSITMKRLRLPYNEIDKQFEKESAEFVSEMNKFEEMKAKRIEERDGNPLESETKNGKEENRQIDN